MRGQHLLPFIIGEVDRGGDEFLVRLGRLCATWALLDRCNDGLQVLQHVLLGSLGLLLATVVETVATALQLTGFQTTVGALCHHRSSKEDLPADPTQMHAVLLARSPTKDRRPPHATTILAVPDSIAVESHGNTSIGITGMDEVAGHIEISTDNIGEDIPCFLVGGVSTPVSEGKHLLLGEVIGKQRRVVALHG